MPILTIADNDNILPIDISLVVFGQESLANSRLVVKQHTEQHVPEWATRRTSCDDSVSDRVYGEWLALQRGRSDDLYKSRLETEVKTFVSKLMAKVAELDPTFQCEATLVGSAREDTRVKLYDEFDFMIVLNEFQALEDVHATHERFPGYVRFKCGENSETFRQFSDEQNIVQPLFVKDKLYSLLIEACSYSDIWEGGIFEYLRTRLECNVYSPAITMKSTLNRLRVEDKLYVYWEREISIDFVPAVPTRRSLRADTPFGHYVTENLPKTDSRAFAVMKPHKYTIGNEANGFCPSNFIMLEAEIVRRAPASVKAAYILLKHLLFCKQPMSVDVNKYTVKQCFLHCIVTHQFDSSQTEDVITPENLIGCVRAIVKRLWQCTQDDAVSSVYDSGHLFPFWEFEPFAGFLKVYFDSCGILYTSDVRDENDDPGSYLTANIPSDMRRTTMRLQSNKVKSVVKKFRASYDRIRHLCSLLQLSEPASDDRNTLTSTLEKQATKQNSERDSRLVRYVLMFDDFINEFYVNNISRALLTPSPYCVGVPKIKGGEIIKIDPEEAAVTFRRIYGFEEIGEYC